MSKIDTIQAATIASYSTSGAGLIFGLGLNEVLAIISIIFIILTYITNLYFQNRKDKREALMLANNKTIDDTIE